MSDESAAFDLSYWLDAGDTIVAVSENWNGEVRQNDAPELDASRIIGRNLISFVNGDATRMYVRTVLQSIRLLRKPMLRSYRCDTPERRRFMEMRLTLEASGLVRWDHRLVHEESLPRTFSFRTLAKPVSHRCVVRCSVCNRLKRFTNWLEPEALLPADEVPDDGLPVIYGVCPDCLERNRLGVLASG